MTVIYAPTGGSQLNTDRKWTDAETRTYLVGTFPEWIATGDFTQDGRLDLVTANRFAQNVSLLAGKTTGEFFVAQPLVELPGSLGLKVRDVLPEGNASLTVTSEERVESIYFFPRRMIVDDFDKNGAPDLLVINDVANEFTVYRGRGDGTFESGIRFSTPADPEFVVAGDFVEDEDAIRRGSVARS